MFKSLLRPCSASKFVLFVMLGAMFFPASFGQDDWYPSKHGADDTLGAINHLSPEKVIEAAKLIKTGKTYPLGVELGRETPAYGKICRR